MIIQDVTNIFHGDRMGMLKHPFGHIWVLLTHKVGTRPNEIKSNAEKLFTNSLNQKPNAQD